MNVALRQIFRLSKVEKCLTSFQFFCDRPLPSLGETRGHEVDKFIRAFARFWRRVLYEPRLRRKESTSRFAFNLHRKADCRSDGRSIEDILHVKTSVIIGTWCLLLPVLYKTIGDMSACTWCLREILQSVVQGLFPLSFLPSLSLFLVLAVRFREDLGVFFSKRKGIRTWNEIRGSLKELCFFILSRLDNHY